MLELLAIPVGALANRFRGGGVVALPTETTVPDHKRTQVRRVASAIAFGLMAWNPWVALVAFASFFTGWGFPVSAAIGKNTKAWEAEWAPLDWLTTFIVGREQAQDYGLMWLTLHGLMTGLVIACLTFNPAWLLLCLMGFCYRLPVMGNGGISLWCSMGYHNRIFLLQLRSCND